jgi:hypothetical protein
LTINVLDRTVRSGSQVQGEEVAHGTSRDVVSTSSGVSLLS